MRIFVLGDPHFKKSNLHIFEQICNEIITIVDERKPDLCVCLGDTLDTHDRINLRAQSMANRFFIDISKRCPLVILIGNHDRENNSDYMSNIHPFVGLESQPNIRVVYESIRETRDKYDFIYVPYVPPGKFMQALEYVDYNPNESSNHPHLIFCHQEFKGCNMGSIVSTKGDTWSVKYPLVIAGHIHEYQVLPKIIYVGTFLQQNYGESDDKALMMLYLEEKGIENTSTLKIGPEDNSSLLFIERIQLKTPPKRKTLHLNLETLPNFAEMLPPDNIRKGSTQIGGTYTRVIFHIDATETKTLKTNPSYRALENTVDKVDIRTESNKANIAEQMVKQIQPEKSTISLEEIVKALLKDDPNTLTIFEKEICVES